MGRAWGLLRAMGGDSRLERGHSSAGSRQGSAKGQRLGLESKGLRGRRNFLPVSSQCFSALQGRSELLGYNHLGQGECDAGWCLLQGLILEMNFISWSA